MIKSLQRGIILWVQAKTGLTGILVAWLGIAAAAAIMMVVFLGVSGCAWLSIKLGPVFGPLGMAGVFLVIAIVAALASVVLRRRTKQRAFLEQTTRAPSAFALVNPAVLNIAMQAARTLGWRRLVPLALLGILAAQLAQAPHRRGPDQSVKVSATVLLAFNGPGTLVRTLALEGQSALARSSLERII